MNSIDKTLKNTLKKYNSVQKSKYLLEKSYTKKHKNEKFRTITYDTSNNTYGTSTSTCGQIYNSISDFSTDLITMCASLFTQNNGSSDIVHPSAAVNIAPVYYTPSQIVTAYGLNKLDVGGFKRGQGMTIAVIIAYHYPNLKNDLDTYSRQFGLPLTTSGQFKFDVISKTTNKNSGWAAECCLDVQSVHTIAPYANILVVEGASASYSDLLIAINIAVLSGASVISMSWGGGESTSVINVLDKYFSSTKNVCFVASSGDTTNLVNYPSTSPNVVSVGGTNLRLNPDNTRKQEIPWYNSSRSGAGNGYSKFITKPQYQSNIPMIKNNYRCTPDISLVADPYTGFVVCYGGKFYIYGGTSLSAPLSSGMIAIANQLRKSKGKSFLTSNSKLVPGQIHNIIYNNIYKTNSNYTNATQYAGNFYDVVTGVSGIYPSATGFDVATGLGSLNANIICNTLANCN
jgi:subtilase family serine protease